MNNMPIVITAESGSSIEISKSTYAAMRGRTPITGPVYIKIEICVSVKNIKKDVDQANALIHRILPMYGHTPQSFIDSVCDGIVCIAIVKKEQITDVFATKRYTKESGLKIYVTPLDAQGVS